MNSSENLTAKVIYAIYYKGKEYPNPFKKRFHIWQDMGKRLGYLQEIPEMEYWEGDCVSFWYDIWTPFSPLRNNFQGTMTSQEENMIVASSIIKNAWNLNEIT